MASSPLTYGPKIAAPVALRPDWTNYMVMRHEEVNRIAARVSGRVSVTEPTSGDVAGATGDGVTDDGAAIQRSWDAISAAGGGVSYFPGGTYCTSVPLALPYNVSLFLEPNAAIKATAAMEAVIQTPLDSLAEDRFIRGGFVLCNGLANVGVDLQWCRSYRVMEICAEDFLVAGYRFGNASSPESSYTCNLHKARSHRRGVAPGVVGGTVPANSISLHLRAATDCFVSDCELVGGETGVQIEHASSNATLVNVHPWVRTTTGAMKYGFVDFAGGTRYINCDADTPSVYGWWLQFWQSCLVNCRHFNNGDGADNTAISVRIEVASSIHTIINLFSDGSDSSHRIAKDFDFAGSSANVTILGNVQANTVTTTTPQIGASALRARGTLTVDGAATVGGSITASGEIIGNLNASSRGAVATSRDYSWYTSTGGGSDGTHNGRRWAARCSADVESGGGNTGSKWQLFSCDDDGTFLNTHIEASRSPGVTLFKRGTAKSPAAITYSASMTPNAAASDVQTITVTNNTAFAINVPTNPTAGQRLTFRVVNSIGGGTATGAATWNAVFKLGSAWGTLADTKTRLIDFHYDGTSWLEIARSADL